MPRIITPEIAAERLAAACSRTEICSSDAIKRLTRQGLSPSDARRIVARLAADGFIDDRRFARAFIRDKYRFAGWGRRKIAYALAARRIDSNIISKALDEAVDPEEYEAKLFDVLSVKARSVKTEMQDTFEGRQKLYAYALGRGYESEIISRVINRKNEEIWPPIF